MVTTNHVVDSIDPENGSIAYSIPQCQEEEESPFQDACNIKSDKKIKQRLDTGENIFFSIKLLKKPKNEKICLFITD